MYAELQNLYARVPQRGIAVLTIASLLESCRTSNQLKLPIKSAITNSVLVRSDKSTNTAFVIDLKPNGNGIAQLSITDEKCAVLSVKSIDEKENQNQKDTEDKSPFLNLPLECMCTCGRTEKDDPGNVCEHSSIQTKCWQCSNKNNEHLNQQKIDQTDKRCNDNSRKLMDETANFIVNTSHTSCEYCLRSSNKLNLTESCSSKCDCIHSFQSNSCSVHLVNNSNKNGNLVSAKSLDDDDGGDDGIASDNNEISTFLNKPEMYDKMGLSISESFENTEAEAVQPTTPSPIISISSGTTGGDDDRLNRDNQTPSLLSPIENDDDKLSTVRDSCSSNNISLTTDASGTSTSTGNGAGKRGKTDAKLVLDLNDRSKYTKEVSV